MESTDDNTTTSYFGFGLNGCTGYQQLSEAQFTAGLRDMESRLSSYSNAGTFIFPASAHTSLLSLDFYTRTAAVRTIDTDVEIGFGSIGRVPAELRCHSRCAFKGA